MRHPTETPYRDTNFSFPDFFRTLFALKVVLTHLERFKN